MPGLQVGHLTYLYAEAGDRNPRSHVCMVSAFPLFQVGCYSVLLSYSGLELSLEPHGNLELVILMPLSLWLVCTIRLD